MAINTKEMVHKRHAQIDQEIFSLVQQVYCGPISYIRSTVQQYFSTIILCIYMVNYWINCTYVPCSKGQNTVHKSPRNAS